MKSFFLLFIFLILSTLLSGQTPTCGTTQTYSNSGGVNNLEDYPLRPFVPFNSPESIYEIVAGSCGEVCLTVSNRTPSSGAYVDVFVVTNPNDASTNILWIDGNGSAGTKCFPVLSTHQYYLVVDGLAIGSTATLEVEMNCLECMACEENLNLSNELLVMSYQASQSIVITQCSVATTANLSSPNITFSDFTVMDNAQLAIYNSGCN